MAESAGSGVVSNKEIALSWVSSLFEGDPRRFRELTHPEFTSVIVGDLQFCGVRDLPQFIELVTKMRIEQFAAGEFEMSIGAVTAEENRVCMEAESRIPMQNGGVYNNVYIWTITVRDGQVVQLKEMIDTLHVATVMSGDEYSTQQAQRTNYLYDTPSRVITGTMAPPLPNRRR